MYVWNVRIYLYKYVYAFTQCRMIGIVGVHIHPFKLQTYMCIYVHCIYVDVYMHKCRITDPQKVICCSDCGLMHLPRHFISCQSFHKFFRTTPRHPEMLQINSRRTKAKPGPSHTMSRCPNQHPKACKLSIYDIKGTCSMIFVSSTTFLQHPWESHVLAKMYRKDDSAITQWRLYGSIGADPV